MAQGRRGARSSRLPARYDAWLGWLDGQDVEAVGFGWVDLRRLPDPGRQPAVRLEEWPFEVEQPLSGEVADRSRRTDFLAGCSDDRLLDSRLVTRVDVLQETVGAPGAADPETIVLRQQRGMRRARQVDTVEAALVGACDGDLSVRQLLGALGTLLGEDAGRTSPERLAAVRALVADGFLLPG